MNSDTKVRTKFQDLINPVQPDQHLETSEGVHEPEYMWRGQRFRIVPMRQAPLLQFRLTVNAQQTLQVKYAYVTYQLMNRRNSDNRNEIVMIVRDSMRITVAGFNLDELDDALLMQRVIELQSVSIMQAEAALKRTNGLPVITDLRVEYGRFDVENCRWLGGDGYWCTESREWKPKPATDCGPGKRQVM